MRIKIKLTKPTLRFDEAIFERDSYRIIFSFILEIENTKGLTVANIKKMNGSIRISMPIEVKNAWELNEHETYKVLFEFAKNIIIEKTNQEGKVEEKIDYIIPVGYANTSCPFNFSKLPEPSEEIFYVEKNEGNNDQVF